MPNTNMATFGTRLYTLMRGGLWVKANIHKSESGAPSANNNQGARDFVRMVVQRSPNQTSDLQEWVDENGNVLAAIDSNGNMVNGGVTAVKAYKTQVTLSAAQITTLHSVPVALVAAPGAGKAILVTNTVFQFKYGTVQFTGGGAVNPVYHSATTNLLSGSVAAATIQAAANATISCGGEASALGLTTNVGIDLLAATADFAAGDSTAIVTVWYSILTLG